MTKTVHLTRPEAFTFLIEGDLFFLLLEYLACSVSVSGPWSVKRAENTAAFFFPYEAMLKFVST